MTRSYGRVLLLCSLFLVLVLGLVGAVGAGASAGAARATKTVAWLDNGLAVTFDAAVLKGAQAEAKKLGFKLQVYDAQFDEGKQLSQFDSALSLHPAAIVIRPVSSLGAISFVARAKKAGIPIISTGIAIGKKAGAFPGTAAFIGHNDVQVGQQAAQFMKKALPNGGNIVILGGAADNTIAIDRANGFLAAVKGSKIKVVGDQATDWTQEKALSVMAGIIQSQPKIDGVYTAADNLAAGAVQALQEAGKLAGVKVVGVGGSKQGFDLIRKGTMTATLYFAPYDDGVVTMQVTAKVLNRQPVAKWTLRPNTPVTKANVSKYKPQW